MIAPAKQQKGDVGNMPVHKHNAIHSIHKASRTWFQKLRKQRLLLLCQGCCSRTRGGGLQEDLRIPEEVETKTHIAKSFARLS